MNKNKVFIKQLDCYEKADDEKRNHRLVRPDSFFDLGKLPDTKIRHQMRDFICCRGTELSLLSVRTELSQFNEFCRFLEDEFPQINEIKEITNEDMIRVARKWLLKNGKSYTHLKMKKERGKTTVVNADLITYINKIYRYINIRKKAFNFDDDRWFVNEIPLIIRKNPVNIISSISFEKIKQDEIKKEIKRVCYTRLMQKALGTVVAEITAVNRFCEFLDMRFPDITSLNEISREVLEEYLVFINTEAATRKSYSKDLMHLKSVFKTAGKIMENNHLKSIFSVDDIGNMPSRIYKVYTDEEIKRLNSFIVDQDEQIARALMLHQLLGTRISETLTLTQDAISENENGTLMIRINQIKSQKEYEKAISKDIKKLFDKACDYTNKKYGNCKYVFVSDKEPSKPLSYGTIKYHLMVMIRENDIRDDNGNLFGVGTHIWRHCYGKKLTELHVDDVTISKLMGHSNTSSLKNYRKVGNKMLADETRDMRNYMDQKLRTIIGGW